MKAAGSRSFSDGLAWIQNAPQGNYPKWGAIDNKGNVVIPFMYSTLPGDFSDGMASVVDQNTGGTGFIDKTNTLRVPCNIERVISPFRKGHAIVSADSKTFLIDKSGNIVEQFAEWPTCDRRDGLCTFTVSGGNMNGLMDTDGNILISAQYFSFIGQFMDGMDGLAWAAAQVNGRQIEGYINIHGDFVVVKGTSRVGM